MALLVAAAVADSLLARGTAAGSPMVQSGIARRHDHPCLDHADHGNGIMGDVATLPDPVRRQPAVPRALPIAAARDTTIARHTWVPAAYLRA